MPPKYHRSNICLVGGNAVSAFLSWRLQATNACDVTLVWKQDFENVAQYGITMRYGYGSRTYFVVMIFTPSQVVEPQARQ
jgi:hypothetical protein